MTGMYHLLYMPFCFSIKYHSRLCLIMYIFPPKYLSTNIDQFVEMFSPPLSFCVNCYSIFSYNYSKLKKNPLDAREMTWQLRAHGALSVDPGFVSLTPIWQLIVIRNSRSRRLMPSLASKNSACIWCTYGHTCKQNTHKHIILMYVFMLCIYIHTHIHTF